MKMNLKKKWRAASLALLLGVGVFASGSAFAQAEEKQYPYYEVSSWNQFHGRMDYFKGTAPEVCAAAIQAWYWVQETPYGYTLITEGVNKGTYEIFPSPPSAFPYILCSADLKYTTIFTDYPREDFVNLLEDSHNLLTIEKKEEFAPNHDPCEEPPNARGTYQRPEYCEPEPPKPQCPSVSHKNNSLCTNMDYANEKGERPIGTVVCEDQNTKYLCIWPEHIEVKKWDDFNCKAREIIEKCTLIHENSHALRSRNSCNTDTHIWGGGSAFEAYDEYDAYVAEMQCYKDEIVNCDGDKDCLADIGTMFNEAKNNMEYYDKQKLAR